MGCGGCLSGRYQRGKERDKRAGLDGLMQAVARREVDMVAAWSVDRLGRSLTDLLGVLQDLHAKGVDLYLHQSRGEPGPPYSIISTARAWC